MLLRVDPEIISLFHRRNSIGVLIAKFASVQFAAFNMRYVRFIAPAEFVHTGITVFRMLQGSA